MTILAEDKTSRGLTLSLSKLDLSVINKVPWCVVSFNFQLNSSSGQYKANNKSYDTYIKVRPSYFQIDFQGLPITSGNFSNYAYFMQEPNNGYATNVYIPVEALSLIESKRVDDVQFMIRFVYSYMEVYFEGGEKVVDGGDGLFIFPYEFSERKWLSFISSAGYNEIWLIEVSKPKIEVFHEVTEHIQKAYEALYNKKEPEDVIRDLRTARDSFRTYYDAKKAKIFEIIDRGSSGEPGKDKKSERINNIFEEIGNLLNIGPHNDKYKVSYADALLAYREFISVIAYLSSILKDVKED